MIVMSPKTQFNMRLDDDVLAAMKAVQQQIGIPVSEQVRRACREWLRQYGYKPDLQIRQEPRRRTSRARR